jgi:small conductance mechanosensitive channel
MNAHHDYRTLIWSSLANLTPRLLTAVIIFVVGYVLAVWISRAVQRMLMRSERIDPTIKPVIVSTVHYVIMILVVVIALDDLGVQTASLIAILGAAGLAIGLALQGTLANIAAGIMLLWLRPFHVGDYIEAPTNNISGTVKEIGLFACLLENAEGVFVFAPNGSVWNTALRNYSRNSSRLISFSVTLPGQTPTNKVQEILKRMMDEDHRILKDPAPVVFLESYDSGKGVVLNCSFGTSQQYAFEIQGEIINDARQRLDHAGIEQNVQIISKTPVLIA